MATDGIIADSADAEGPFRYDPDGRRVSATGPSSAVMPHRNGSKETLPRLGSRVSVACLVLVVPAYAGVMWYLARAHDSELSQSWIGQAVHVSPLVLVLVAWLAGSLTRGKALGGAFLMLATLLAAGFAANSSRDNSGLMMLAVPAITILGVVTACWSNTPLRKRDILGRGLTALAMIMNSLSWAWYFFADGRDGYIGGVFVVHWIGFFLLLGGGWLGIKDEFAGPASIAHPQRSPRGRL